MADLVGGARVASGAVARVEWRTVALLGACYGVWGIATYLYATLGWVVLPAAAVTVALHLSLQHEAIHGHPTRSRLLNDLLVFPALALCIPYGRYRTTHLRHHNDRTLTDPALDPESFYLTPDDWQNLPGPARAVLRVNNTLAGRLVLGPVLWVAAFFWREARALLGGNRRIAAAWLAHLPALAVVYFWLEYVVGLNIWLYGAAVAYPALMLINLRTFAEHRAHAKPGPRSAIVHTSWVFSLLYLNNNLHYVHHKYPTAPWYRLPLIYRAGRAALEAENGGYIINGYSELLRRYGFKPKEPVDFPLAPAAE